MSVRARLVQWGRLLEPRFLDGGLAAVLTIWTLAGPGHRKPLPAATAPAKTPFPLPPGPPPSAAHTLVLVLMTLAIARRRSHPNAVLAVQVAGVLLLTSQLELPQGVSILIASYSAAFHGDRWLALGMLTVAGAWVVAYGSVVQIPHELVPFLLLAPAWLAGVAMRHREQQAAASAARADRLELEREVALRAERARIARELHDVVTHSVSVMVLQTGAAREILSQDESRADALLGSVQTSGRAALEELRRLLGLLSDTESGAPRSPQPGVTEIPALVEQVQHAGLPVELLVEGRPRAVSGGAAVAAYRIVQEALTNVLRHASGAHTRVILRWAQDTLELEVSDDGGPGAAAAGNGGLGRGLAGMRERAAMYGGTLDAHEQPGRGYVVRARIPLQRRGA